MRVTGTEKEPFDSMVYARVSEGSKGVEHVDLPFYNVYVDRMPSGLTAIVATSDLQGVTIGSQDEGYPQYEDRYMGHAVAEQLVHSLAIQGIDQSKTGVLLLGDFHSDLNLKWRGGYGDVRDVWVAFHEKFKWVVGVAGNHDTFGTDQELADFRKQPRLHLLDGGTVVVDGMRLCGASGVIGNPKKPWRHDESDHLHLIQEAIKSSPRFLLLHEGPSVSEKDLRGNDTIRAHLEAQSPCTVICGHRHWPGNEMHALSNGTSLINTDGKIIVFRKRPWEGKDQHEFAVKQNLDYSAPDQAVNFRDVGEFINLITGRHVMPEGKLYRGGTIKAISDPAVIGSPKTIIALQKGPDHEMPGIRNFHFPISNDYEKYHTEVPEVRHWLRSIIKQFEAGIALPVYIHCLSGRDRTGVVVASLLKILGVADDHIVEEYRLSIGAKEAGHIRTALAGISNVDEYFENVDLQKVRRMLREEAR